jgi:hypothetical protein
MVPGSLRDQAMGYEVAGLFRCATERKLPLPPLRAAKQANEEC